jgi:MOSC domain-containing protein YiiM
VRESSEHPSPITYPPQPPHGVIIQINISLGGIPKRSIAAGVITPLGLAGDAHAHPQIHGGPLRAVLLIASETIDELKSRGYPVFYGALGENLTTRGLDPRQLRVGHQLQAGAAVLEVTKVRGPCAALDVYGPAIKQEIYDERVKAGDPTSPRWGMGGFYARVIRPGPVQPNDLIAILSALA